MSHHPNIELLERVADRLGELTDQFVFLGGSTTTLLITDPAAPPVRASIDVDAIVRTDSLADYHRLGKALREKGFTEDTSDGAPVCRWRTKNVTFDVMPTDESILGFGNRWYEQAIETASGHSLPSGRSIRLATAPYFLATKLEAFHGRGHGDYLASEDMEDIISVLDGRPELLGEIATADTSVRRYLADQMSQLLATQGFRQALPGHLEAASTSSGRSATVLEKMGAIASLV